MRRLRTLAALALAWVVGTSAHALDLVEVWRAAQRHDAQFAASRASRDAGDARRAQSRALWRPTVAVEGGASLATNETAVRGARFAAPGFGDASGVAFDTSVTGGTGSRVALLVRQPLISSERDAQGAQLRISAAAAEHAWLDAQQALMLRAAERYFDAALAAEQLRLLERQHDAVERARIEALDRFRAGDRPVIDTHDAGARAAALQAQRLAAQTELEIKREALADLSGLAAGNEPLALPAATPAADAVGLDGWLSRAEQGNPMLAIARTQLAAAMAEARKTDAALSPTVDLVAQVGRERLSGSGDFGHGSNTTSHHAIGVQVSVPLYTGGWRSARQVEAAALVEKARAEQEQARRQIALSTRAAWLDLSVGAGRIAALESALEANRIRLDATKVGLEAGDRTTLDLLNAENDAAAAELALHRTRVQVLTHRLRLTALAGQLDETSLQQANSLLRPIH